MSKRFWNMYKKGLVKSYATPPLAGNPREVEAWGLTQAAIRMKGAQETGDPEAIRAAVRLNWQLWTIFQAELLSPQCTTPIDLRTNALSLAKFIDKQIVDVISDAKPEKLDILITINRELASGLYETPKESGDDSAEKSAGDDANPPQTPPSGGITV